jgi:hypothetical protein
MDIRFLFRFVVDIYVGFASASSNLAAPSHNSPRSTWECTDLLCTFHAFCDYTTVLPNILLAEEVGQCPQAPSREDIVVHGAGVRPLARQNILPLTGSDDSEQFHCVVQKCHQSALSTTVSHLEEASGQWLSSQPAEWYVVCGTAWPVIRKRASISASYCVRTLYYWFWDVFYQHRVFI